ncbi:MULTISPECIES: multidrug efflux transporter transcriptional repressor AcrS [Escherichia]|uniref:multidrug efflux transporter transcriptional repressor AcrS n=2 Tax=Enterobacteriaceae TaxID=543 RepID=UPI00033105EB|nr:MULTISPECIES: multidrug efflux transporter transcriptional repressor AcrS [Escherichia]MBA0990351.1 multidrug efflux transporter transcriptional repressor AcrS [Escherichia coli]EOQ54907.1 DNA-binding transcriptional regulator [Escherichia coli KTE33]EOU82485.1 transcriptional regulator EnvR [Escherichia sp. KTE31]HAY5554188.1 multidrug efflux transporter transcriptional repressor AcrS [Escherichia coli]HCN5543506.1 multidrug efflux transporter transcriptional repressor AcrS [Escherichia co
MAKRTKAEALKTRQELIETAIAQFALHGVSKTTLNDIADAANVTRGAIYWHFENKTQLFNEMWLQQPPLRELIQERLAAGSDHNPYQQLREKLIVGLQYIAEIPRQQALLQILYHKCEFNDEMLAEAVIREKMGFNPQTLHEVLQSCQQQGCVANNLDLDVVMIIIDGAFSGIVQNWLMNMAGYDLYKQAPALVDNVLRMFMPDENITKLIHQTNELSVM